MPQPERPEVTRVSTSFGIDSLVEATTGKHVWAKRYDRKLADIFAIQDELTEAIVGEIEPELAEVERERAYREPPESLNAWDCYQRGLWHMWQLAAELNVAAVVTWPAPLSDSVHASGRTRCVDCLNATSPGP